MIFVHWGEKLDSGHLPGASSFEDPSRFLRSPHRVKLNWIILKSIQIISDKKCPRKRLCQKIHERLRRRRRSLPSRILDAARIHRVGSRSLEDGSIFKGILGIHTPYGLSLSHNSSAPVPRSCARTRGFCPPLLLAHHAHYSFGNVISTMRCESIIK